MLSVRWRPATSTKDEMFDTRCLFFFLGYLLTVFCVSFTLSLPRRRNGDLNRYTNTSIIITYMVIVEMLVHMVVIYSPHIIYHILLLNLFSEGNDSVFKPVLILLYTDLSLIHSLQIS